MSCVTMLVRRGDCSRLHEGWGAASLRVSRAGKSPAESWRRPRPAGRLGGRSFHLEGERADHARHDRTSGARRVTAAGGAASAAAGGSAARARSV